MKHFDIGEWTDFARGVTVETDRAAMEAHLSSGCVRCRGTVDLVKRIVGSAQDDGRFEPPEHVVRCAKAIGTLLRSRTPRSHRLIARLVYDSFRDPLPVGMRAVDRVSRHALYEADNFYLDLRVEQEKGSPFVTLVGQLTNREDPDGPLDEAPVLLMARKELIAYAVCNRYGEFQMDYVPEHRLRLCVALDTQGKRIELTLKPLMAEVEKRSQSATARRQLGQDRAGRQRK